MTTVRKRHDAEFKKKVALEAIRQQQTINQITSEYGIHATPVNQWKKQATEAIGQVFGGGKKRAERDLQQEVDELHRQLGQVVSERDWLKKKSSTCRW